MVKASVSAPTSLWNRRRAWLWLSVAVALLMAGCATVTPEQAARRELLWRAAQNCQRRYPFISRFEFDRFDRLLWWYREGTPHTDRDLFTGCYREQVTELTKQATASAPTGLSAQPSAPAGGPHLTSGSWKESPVWKVGDEWSYRWESPRGGGTFVWRVAFEETVGGMDCFVIDSGRYQTYYRKSDLAIVQRKDRGVLEYKYTPPRQFVTWPLHVGRTWEALYVQEWPKTRTTSNRLRAWHVEAAERITVPAGPFEVFKIVERDKWANAVVAELWLAPEIKGLVRMHLQFDYGVEKTELTAFKLN